MSTYRDNIAVDNSGTSCHALHLAIMIARTFVGRAPTVSVLRDKFGMSRASAYRWVRAWKDANGIAA